MADQSTKDPSIDPKAGAGKPDDSTSSGTDGKPDEEGKNPATLADLAASEARQKVENATLYQGIQSLLDRQGQNLKASLEPLERFNSQLEMLGIEITPEQKEQLRQAEVMHTLTEQGSGERGDGKNLPPADPTQRPDPNRQELSPTQQIAVAMMDKTGIRLSQEDTAEIALIDQETTDLEVFRASFKAALDAKVTRLASGADGTGEPDKTVTEPKDKGPKLNPRGTGDPSKRLLPEETPGGAKTSSLDFLSAGYQESDDFPSEE